MGPAEIGALYAGLALKASAEARSWVQLWRERGKTEKWDYSESRYQLDRLFSSLREDGLKIPMYFNAFPSAQLILKSMRDKYLACVELRDTHKELKEDPFYSLETEYLPPLKELIARHNEHAKGYPVDPL